jgi:hypothetical protein
LGRSLTGNDRYATAPNSAMAAISRLVAMGRRMNPSEIFTGGSLETRSARPEADVVRPAEDGRYVLNTKSDPRYAEAGAATIFRVFTILAR